MERSRGLRILALVFLICITAGSVIQNWQLRERVVKLEPRITQVERTIKVPIRAGKKIIVINRIVVKRPVVKRIVVSGPRGPKGDRGPIGPMGISGRPGKSIKGDTGAQREPGKDGIIIEDDLRNTVSGLEDLVSTLGNRVDALNEHVNQLLCNLLQCTQR